jgi:hypothetical protein
MKKAPTRGLVEWWVLAAPNAKVVFGYKESAFVIRPMKFLRAGLADYFVKLPDASSS